MHIIRKMAAERGLRPHTYIGSILHQLAAGHTYQVNIMPRKQSFNVKPNTGIKNVKLPLLM
jgi:hypothetical protein